MVESAIVITYLIGFVVTIIGAPRLMMRIEYFDGDSPLAIASMTFILAMAWPMTLILGIIAAYAKQLQERQQA